MNIFNLMNLGNLALLSDAETRSISAENPTGEKGGSAKAVPDKDNPASQHAPFPELSPVHERWSR
ncbi:MAG: hypothetical protein V3S14_12870 [Anaerolineae bacterium]